MKIEKVTLFHVQLPMKFNFKTAKGELKGRDTLIIKVENGEGISGFGECVAFVDPFYTSETFDAAWEKLKSDDIPRVLKREISHPFELHEWLSHPLPMAFAGLENAFLDLYYKEKNENLIRGLFKENLAEKIPRGAVLGEMPLDELLIQIGQLVQKGVRRIKLKISPEDGFERVKAAVTAFPELQFAVDANRSFALTEWKEVARLDQLGLICIEEPFDINGLDALTERSAQINTPLCFDESVQTLADLTELSKLPGKTMLNVKIGRLGGLYTVKQAIDFCRKNGIDFWVGSMVESGISKILHVQLAALDGNVMAGDLSDSQHYFDEDLIRPELAFPEGWMPVPTGAGIGVEVNEDAILRHCIRKEVFQ